ncbi:MAG: hypothetical protein C5B51_07445 [Terriglobia bacterium]|nr:MAG: hypothetical protein C5B51_07445 [Terriglobia bacterium]
MRGNILPLVFAAVLMSALTAYGHHSLSATYYPEKEVKLEGKILDLLLRNPHSFLQIEAPDESGVMQRWSLEWRSSGQLGQQGIKRDTLKVGDEVVITMNPSRTPADHRGALKTLHRKSDGFGWGTNPGETIE